MAEPDPNSERTREDMFERYALAADWDGLDSTAHSSGSDGVSA